MPKTAFARSTAHNQKGVTLIEVMIVIIILAILGVTGISTYRLLYVRTDLENVAQEVGVDISSARLESVAARNGKTYGVRFFTDRYELYYEAPETIYLTKSLPSNVTFSDISLKDGSSELLFNKLTGFTDNPGSVTLELRDESYTIIITPQGLVNVERS